MTPLLPADVTQPEPASNFAHKSWRDRGRQGGKESLPFHRRREADVDGTDVSAQ